MLDRDFVCCCIPLLNAGVYFILFEQLLVGIVAGVATIATSTVIGALSLPGFTGWIFAILCFAVAALQVLGLVGVVQERTKLFKTYSFLNLAAVLAAFVCGAVLTLVAGLKHADSSSQCQSKYYGNSTSATTGGANATLSLADSADEICDIFVLVDASLMGGLWLLLAVVQAYFLFVIRLYARDQKSDHSRYFSMYSTKGGFPEEDIPLSHPSSDPWAVSRRSTDSLAGGYGGPPAPSGHQQPEYRDERGPGGEAFQVPAGHEGYGREEGVYQAEPTADAYAGHHQHQQEPQQQQQQHGRQPSYDYQPGQPFPQHEQGYSASPTYQDHQQYPHQPAYPQQPQRY